MKKIKRLKSVYERTISKSYVQKNLNSKPISEMKVKIFYDMKAYKSFGSIDGMGVCYYRFEVPKNQCFLNKEIVMDDRFLHCLSRTAKVTEGLNPKEIRFGYTNELTGSQGTKTLLIAVQTPISIKNWTIDRINKIKNEFSYDEVHYETHISKDIYNKLTKIYYPGECGYVEFPQSTILINK